MPAGVPGGDPGGGAGGPGGLDGPGGRGSPAGPGGALGAEPGASAAPSSAAPAGASPDGVSFGCNSASALRRNTARRPPVGILSTWPDHSSAESSRRTVASVTVIALANSPTVPGTLSLACDSINERRCCSYCWRFSCEGSLVEVLMPVVREVGSVDRASSAMDVAGAADSRQSPFYPILVRSTSSTLWTSNARGRPQARYRPYGACNTDPIQL